MKTKIPKRNRPRLAHFWNTYGLFKNGPTPGLFFVYFRSFETNIITIFTTDQCEKMSCPSSIRCRDSNPRPSRNHLTRAPAQLMVCGAVFSASKQCALIHIDFPKKTWSQLSTLRHCKMSQLGLLRPVWPDGQIIFQYLAICSNEN